MSTLHFSNSTDTITEAQIQWPQAVSQSVSDLFGDLSKVVDEANGGCFLQWVVDVVDVHLTLVEQVVEDVDCFHGWRTLLLVAKNEVDPFMEVGRHIVALQRLQPRWKTIQGSRCTHLNVV